MGLMSGDYKASCPRSLKSQSPDHIGLSILADKCQQSQGLKQKGKGKEKNKRSQSGRGELRKEEKLS